MEQLAQDNEAMVARAVAVMPGGVSSPVRAFRAVGGKPRFIVRASGAKVVDVEGREYIDYVGAWGGAILGHAHPAVIAAIHEAASCGTAFGLSCPLEVELAEQIRRRMPSVERVRFVNSGTEAVMSAIRVARAATGRDGIVKFDGCYHGHADALLVRAGSGAATLGLPDSPGVTAHAVADTLTVRYNDVSGLHRLFDRVGANIAAVIVEPVAGNMGVVPPAPGFLEFLRDICDRAGALFIIDEVMTGFRVAPGGAQERFAVRGDLVALGKIIGGGLPVGAYGGRADLMGLVAPQGPVYQAGTFSGNPLTMSAGLATLRLLDAAAYQRLERHAAELERGLIALLSRHSVCGCVQRVGSMLTLFFGVERVVDFEGAARADHARFARFFRAMLEHGVHLPPSGYEAWFVSLAHDESIIHRTLECADRSLAAART